MNTPFLSPGNSDKLEKSQIPFLRREEIKGKGN